MTGSHIYMKTLRINELLLTPVWHGVNYDWDCELWLVLWDICHFSTFTFWLRSRPLVSRAPMVMRGGWPPGQVRWELIAPCSDRGVVTGGGGGHAGEGSWSLGPVAHNQGRMGNDWVDTPPRHRTNCQVEITLDIFQSQCHHPSSPQILISDSRGE